MIVKTSIKGNNILCDCCNKKFNDTIMKHYEIGAFKTITLCKECEEQLASISKVNTVKKVISIDDILYY